MADSAEVATLPLECPCLLRCNLNLCDLPLWYRSVYTQVRDHQAVRDVIGREGKRYCFPLGYGYLRWRKGEPLSMDLNDLRLLLCMYRGPFIRSKT